MGTEQQLLLPYYVPYAPTEVVVELTTDVTRMQAAYVYNNIYF